MATKSSLLRTALVELAGQPLLVRKTTIEGVRYRIHYWWVTTVGKRANDWHSLLIMYDRALELGLKAYFAFRYDNIYRGWRSNRSMIGIDLTPCEPEVANCVVVWIPY